MLKCLLLELVVMISLAVVEAGAMQTETLGLNFRFLSELAAWLGKTLEHLITNIERQQAFTPPLLICKTLDFMRTNLHPDI